MILLNPGPVTLSPRVRAALQGEDICHREVEFASLTLALQKRLLGIYPDALSDYAAVLLTGSGSCAVEAMLSTFCIPERPTLVLCNGAYGERMAQMLRQQHKAYLTLDFGWLQPLDIERIADLLGERPDIAAVAVVHHETTTGRLNALPELARLCEEKGIGLLIDAVSSFGAEELDFSTWKPIAVAATANKCLHGIPGAAFVVAQQSYLRRNQGFSTSLYLDLERYYSQQCSGWSPFTQAVQAFQALHEALLELAGEGGWRARQKCYQARSSKIAKVLSHLNIEPLLDPQASASMLRAYRLPQAMDYPELHDALKASGFIIYAGQGVLSTDIFRIATMGAIGQGDLNRLCSTFGELLGKGAR